MNRKRRKAEKRKERPIPVDGYSLCVILTADGPATGFVFLKPTWVVTAKHVAIDHDGCPRILRALFLDESISARLLFAHPSVDLAVLELERPGLCRAPLLPGDRLTEGGRLLAIGHRPSISDRTAGRYTQFVAAVRSFKRMERERSTGVEVVHDFLAPFGEPGYSGGPIIGSGGAVVSVVIENYIAEGQPRMRAISVASLLECLTLPVIP